MCFAIRDNWSWVKCQRSESDLYLVFEGVFPSLSPAFSGIEFLWHIFILHRMSRSCTKVIERNYITATFCLFQILHRHYRSSTSPLLYRLQILPLVLMFWPWLSLWSLWWSLEYWHHKNHTHITFVIVTMYNFSWRALNEADGAKQTFCTNV